MEDSKRAFRKKIILSFAVIILLILGSGILGWVLTQRIETSNKIKDSILLFKEADLQLRREEKNLLIRGYSYQGFLDWQQAKEDFHQRFGELIGLEALSANEIDEIKTNNSIMSDTYNRFFDDIKLNTLSEIEKAKYDKQFKKIGQRTLEIINAIFASEQELSARTNSQTNILIALFLIIFVSTATFLILNVLKHL